MAREWYFLIHQIPPRPLYLRAKIRNRLAKVGAVALKNAVYVLPRSSDALEDLQWIAEEVTSGGGQAWICEGRVLGGIDDDALVTLFHAARADDYASIRAELNEIGGQLRGRSVAESAEGARAALNRARERHAEVLVIDFFDSPAGKEVSTMIRSIESKLERTKAGRAPAPQRLKGRTWVTRSGVRIDRIASSWLIRRFIDPDARFRFVEARSWSKRAEEIAFDIVGGDYSHEADRCTFETLVARFDIRDRAAREIAEIVHDIDLKDGKFDRSDAQGIQLLIQGIVSGYPSDEDRLERGLAVFDDLARSFATPSKAKPRRDAGGAPRKVPARKKRAARSRGSLEKTRR